MKDANFGMAPRGALANPMLHLDEIARLKSSKEIIARVADDSRIYQLSASADACAPFLRVVLDSEGMQSYIGHA